MAVNNVFGSLAPSRGGIAEALGMKPNPFLNFVGDNRSALLGLAAGLAGGSNWGGGLSMGFANAAQGGQMDQQRVEKVKAEAKAVKQTNATRDWLAQHHPDLAQAVDAGLPVSQAWQEAFSRQQGGDANPYQERFAAGQQFGLDGDALNTFALTGAIPGTNKSNVTYGLTPIYGTDTVTGKTGMGVQGSDGSFKLVDTGDFQPLGPYDSSALKAAGTAFGKQTGGAQFDVPGAELTMNQTIAALNDIRAQQKGMDEQFGNFAGVPQQMTPAWPGSEKAKFQVAVDRGTNLAFMQAREMLRGGGQITDFESRKAETAITNMQAAMEKGDKAQFIQALDTFEQAVKDGYTKLVQQASALPSYGVGQQPKAANQTSTGITWSVEP